MCVLRAALLRELEERLPLFHDLTLRHKNTCNLACRARLDVQGDLVRLDHCNDSGRLDRVADGCQQRLDLPARPRGWFKSITKGEGSGAVCSAAE